MTRHERNYRPTKEDLAFDKISSYLSLREKHLESAASDCTVSADEFSKRIFLDGSILYWESLTLYALVRVLKPTDILEMGTFIGTSTKFIIHAMFANNHGNFTSVDLVSPDPLHPEMLANHGRPRAGNLTDHERQHVTLLTENAASYIKSLPDNSIDFIFEDTDHTYATTLTLFQEAQRVLRPDGVFVAHDYGMVPMKKAFTEAGIYEEAVKLACGLLIWRK